MAGHPPIWPGDLEELRQHRDVDLTPDGTLGRGDNPDWPDPPRTLRLGPDEVHVWRVGLDLEDHTSAPLYGWLSADERDRAARFALDRHRRWFIVGRGALRAILGHYLAVDPAALAFRYGPSGKPALARALDPPITFNLSHSHDRALCVVTVGREVGIDLERISADRAATSIAERFFTTREVEGIRDLPAELQAEAFFACWTRKEAYIKACGSGLSMGLHRFSVTVDPGEAATIVAADDPAEIARWTMRAFSPWAGYAAAVVVEGTGTTLRSWTWRPPDRP